jgi:CubicO group peptidase (beta-lactamase class C family)
LPRKLKKNCRKIQEVAAAPRLPHRCLRPQGFNSMKIGASLPTSVLGGNTTQWPLIALSLALWLASPVARASDCPPSFNAGGPDAEAYGAADNYPTARIVERGEQRYLVGSQTSFDKLLPGPTVAAPAQALPLTRGCEPFQLRYRHEGQPHTLDDYLTRHPMTGLIIMKGQHILLERYQYGRRDTDRFVSQSMAKTITAMLFGIALNDGKIRSLDDRAEDYVAELKGSAYGTTSLRALLTMSSGVAFSETYRGDDDMAKFTRDLRRPNAPGAATLLRGYSNREVPESTRFRYASTETEVLGLVLAAAIGQRLTDYASERLWKPLGAEADATWSADRKGDILAFCCFSARLRDFARFGLLLAKDGGGVVPAPWVIEATSAPPDSWRAPRRATEYHGYGYQTWLLPGDRRMFAARGIHGQAIFVDPTSKLVLVHTAARLRPNNDPATRELTSLWLALVRQHGK